MKTSCQNEVNQKKLIWKIDRMYIMHKIKEEIDTIQGPRNNNQEKFQKIEAPLHSNLQVLETHCNRIINMELLNSFKIVLPGQVK